MFVVTTEDGLFVKHLRHAEDHWCLNSDRPPWSSVPWPDAADEGTELSDRSINPACCNPLGQPVLRGCHTQPWCAADAYRGAAPDQPQSGARMEFMVGFGLGLPIAGGARRAAPSRSRRGGDRAPAGRRAVGAAGFSTREADHRRRRARREWPGEVPGLWNAFRIGPVGRPYRFAGRLPNVASRHHGPCRTAVVRARVRSLASLTRESQDLGQRYARSNVSWTCRSLPLWWLRPTRDGARAAPGRIRCRRRSAPTAARLLRARGLDGRPVVGKECL